MKMSKDARQAYNEYHKNWRDKNKEHVREYSRNWRENNRDRVKKHQRDYWERVAKEQQKQGENEKKQA